MVTVPIKDKYVEILTAFGDLQATIDLALQRYTIEQITTKVAELRQKDAAYQTKYGLDYPTFARRIAEEETFVNQVEANVSKTWEFDLADWEFCYKGIEDWTQKLKTILLP
jgi:hypothetical protein